MENFDQMLMDGLVRQLILSSTDQYGNKVSNPVEQAVGKWAEAHKVEILEKVATKLDINKLADAVAKNVVEMIQMFGGRYSNYDRSNYKQELDKLITEKLAERIAYTIEIPKSE